MPQLVEVYGFSTGQTQLIFGVFIAVFSVAMIFGRSLMTRLGVKKLAFFSALIYTSGYVIVGLEGISFGVLFLGISLFPGIATGFGYLFSISVPVEWYPHRKGLITGIVSAGFGGGAIAESIIVQQLFNSGFSLQNVFLIVGLAKGFLLFLASFFLYKPDDYGKNSTPLVPVNRFVKDSRFWRLVVGIFTGTFAGLLVVGNLKPIGEQYPIDETTLVLGITVFSIANFSGRLFWGWINDYISGNILIPASLLMMGLFTVIIGLFPLSSFLYLFISFAVGFGFGANFVIYAKETAQVYGLENLGRIYPFVFLAYGISGIAGPFTGGGLRDLFGNYQNAAFVSFVLCVVAFAGIVVYQYKQRVATK